MPPPRPWRSILLVCAAVALISLLLNIALPHELAGEWPIYTCARRSLGKVANSGTVWAALGIYAGWRVADPLYSPLAGAAAGEATLVLHYALGQLLGVYDSSIWASNRSWFVLAALLCAPLGLCGWLATQRSRPGVIARLIVPAGALAEPLLTHDFWPGGGQVPWPERYSDVISGALLIILGIAGAIAVLRRASWRDRAH